jgi:hypothetical protein
MSLLEFVIVLIVVGLAWYLIENYVPLPRPIIIVLRAVGVIALVLFLLALFGIVHMPFRLM